jgi:excinuclease ABC subunit A
LPVVTKKALLREEKTSTLKDVLPEAKLSYLELKGACLHNLKNCAVRVPLGRFIAVCGVSGSGKTSLIQHTLYPLMAAHLGLENDVAKERAVLGAASIGPAKVLAQLSAVHMVSQASIGRSSRSNIVTYLDIYSSIRQLLAAEEAARLAGLGPGSFSFNVPGGRCETCKGLGTVSEDLSFLGEMAVECPTCQGKRFRPEVLTIRYNGLNLLEILALTANEARQFFHAHRKLRQVLDQVVALGLGYVTLGQHTSSFSGGEAQRLKLLALLIEKKLRQGMVFIFDEPTTGLSDADVDTLIKYFRQIVAEGHTLIVVEHHLQVLRACDYLIEIGPGAADHGGRVVFQGAPELLRGIKESPTAPFL